MLAKISTVRPITTEGRNKVFYPVDRIELVTCAFKESLIWTWYNCNYHLRGIIQFWTFQFETASSYNYGENLQTLELEAGCCNSQSNSQSRMSLPEGPLIILEPDDFLSLNFFLKLLFLFLGVGVCCWMRAIWNSRCSNSISRCWMAASRSAKAFSFSVCWCWVFSRSTSSWCSSYKTRKNLAKSSLQKCWHLLLIFKVIKILETRSHNLHILWPVSPAFCWIFRLANHLAWGGSSRPECWQGWSEPPGQAAWWWSGRKVSRDSQTPNRPPSDTSILQDT